jgi:hypothetical protein
MAKPIVDQLEIVQVDKQNWDASELPISSGEGALQPVLEEGTIG